MRKGFNFYRSYYEVAKELNSKDREKFLWALLQRQFEGIEPDLDGMSRFAYLSQKHSIDSQVAGYEAKTNTTLGGCQGGTEGGSVQEKEKEKVEYTIKRFTPPTLQEVDEYCKHRKNNVDPIKWHNFYESKGWMVGRNKMKDWKAAVRTWEKNQSTPSKDIIQQPRNLKDLYE